MAGHETQQMTSHPFDVMGTSSIIIVRADAGDAAPHLEAAERELREISAAFTRFDASSELERLNDAGSGDVSDDLWEMLVFALEAHRMTEGRVDVSLGAELIAAGYDRTFAQLDVPESVDAADIAPDRGGFELVGQGREPGYELGEGHLVSVRPGVRIDLGGIAKGWAADRIRGRLAGGLGASCLVNLGGDIAVHVADGDAPWPIGVDLGDGTQTYDVAFGGLATSGLDRRYWRDAATGELAHHVIDPRTGRPGVTDILRITVFASSCAEAEVWAKALFLERRSAAVAEADRRSIASVIVAKDGSHHFTGGLAS